MRRMATKGGNESVDKPSVAITGLYVRNPKDGVVEVLVEIDEKWRQVFIGAAAEFKDGEVSEMVEVAGIERGKIVDLGGFN